MAAIGNSPTQQAFTPAIDYFSGNASTTAFTLSRPVASVAQVQVVVNNVAQNPSSAYTISSNTITFTSAPSSGTNNIYVYYTSPITDVIAPGQGTVNTTSLGNITNIASGNSSLTLQTGAGNTTAVALTTGQYVGLGTTTPIRQLTVSNSNTSTEFVLQNTYAQANGRNWRMLANEGNSTTNANLSIELLNDAGTATTTQGLKINGATGILSTPAGRKIDAGSVPAGSVIQTQWTDMGSTNAQGTNSTPVNTGFSNTFTPKFSTSKVLHIIVIGMYFICDGRFYIGKSGSVVSPSLGDSSRVAYDWYNDMAPTTVTWIDTPGTTSTITYQIFAAATGCGNSWAVGSSSDFQWSWTMMEIAV